MPEPAGVPPVPQVGAPHSDRSTREPGATFNGAAEFVDTLKGGDDAKREDADAG